MQFVTKRVDVGGVSRPGAIGSGAVAGRASLSLYNEVPQEELTLDEFEVFALDRLQLLRGIEVLRTRGFDGKEFSEKLQLVR